MGKTTCILSYSLLIFFQCFVLSSQKVKWKGYTTSDLTTLAEENSDMNSFKDQLKKIYMERVPGTKSHETVQKNIKQTLGGLGWTLEEDTFMDDTPFGRKKFNNIIATYNFHRDSYSLPRAKKRIVLACHYDSKDMRREGFTFMGATDSAVPCAILLDLAKKLDCSLQKGNMNTPAEDITVQLLFLDGEEAFEHWTDVDSLYGSRHLAQAWEGLPDENDPGENKLKNIAVIVLLDLIGTSETKFRDYFEGTSSTYERFTKIEDNLIKKKLLNPSAGGSERMFLKNAAYWSGVQDDHIPFLKRGVKIVHLISSPFPSVWHTKHDVYENLDMAKIDNFNRIFRVFVSSYLHLKPMKGCETK